MLELGFDYVTLCSLRSHNLFLQLLGIILKIGIVYPFTFPVAVHGCDDGDPPLIMQKQHTTELKEDRARRNLGS